MTVTTLNAVEHFNQWMSVYAERLHNADYTALFLCHQPNGFRFDRAHAEMLNGKPVVLIDFREFGWQDSWRNCDVVGWSKERSPMYPEEAEYDALREWLHRQKVVLY